VVKSAPFYAGPQTHSAVSPYQEHRRPSLKIIYVTESGNTGYALSGKQYIMALLELGVKIQWVPTRWTQGGAVPADADPFHPELQPLTKKVKDPDLVLLHLMPTEHNSHLPMDQAPTVAYTTWETDRLPASFLPPLAKTSRVIVPSSWNQGVFQDSGVGVPVHIVPHLLEESLADSQAEFSSEIFTFYSIAPWTDRKALALVVEAFCQAFSAKDGVRLILKTTRTDLTRHSHAWGLRHLLNSWNTTQRALKKILARFNHPPEVRLVHGQLRRQELLDFHRNYHCFVLLSRGEGWGLGAFEAAASGVPVIVTNYGGSLDFLHPERAFLVDYEIRPCRVSPWEALFTPEQNWAEPVIEHAVQQMRNVYDDFAEAREKARVQAQQIQLEFSREVCGAKLLEFLKL
jgi:glycosyltransferase involved in cell wall biosynthesis